LKTQLETITSQSDQSFSMMFNPRLSDLFFWHFHPEYELVFIDNATGKRRVGDHISDYHHWDLALVGSNIPHLNWDYGVYTDYRKVVLHLKKEFVEDHLMVIPEFLSIGLMFEKSRHGIVFKGREAFSVGDKLFQMEYMSQSEQYLHLIKILSELSQLEECRLLHDVPYVPNYSNKEQRRLQDIYAFVDKHYDRKVDLEEVASICNLTKEAFCRYFKKTTQYTFIEFLNRYRISQAKRLITDGSSISEACYQSGFESLSYFNRIFNHVAGENPREFRKRYIKK